jgi:hypothetical protein
MIPESREVYEHGNREYDRSEQRYERRLAFLAGLIVGIICVYLLVVVA